MHRFLYHFSLFIRNLFSGRIHMIIFPHNQLRNRYNGVPLVFKIRQHGIQGICGVFCSIMAENDSSRSKCFVVTYGVNDRIHTVIFPVQTVDGPLDWIIIECICCLNYLIVICPVWWPEEKHLISCKFLHFVMHAL